MITAILVISCFLLGLALGVIVGIDIGQKSMKRFNKKCNCNRPHYIYTKGAFDE